MHFLAAKDSWQSRYAKSMELDRFEAKVVRIPESGCWLWVGSLDGKGYGQLTVQMKVSKAHRIAYERQFGRVPEGLELDHLCRVPSCCNPLHLEAVTHQVNIQRAGLGDIHRKRTALITHCPSGHEYAGSNLRISKKGSRHCKRCAADAWEAYRAKSN